MKPAAWVGSAEENRKLLRKAEKLGDSRNLPVSSLQAPARVRFESLLLTEAPHQVLPTLGDGPGAGVCFLSLPNVFGALLLAIWAQPSKKPGPFPLSP